jgi:hypothetical protein
MNSRLTVNPNVYLVQASNVMLEATELLKDPSVHQNLKLEDLIISAPRWGALDSFFQGKPEFDLRANLPEVLRKINGQHGISAELGRELLKRFEDYQWSRTPRVWDSYLQARLAASYASNPRDTYGDPSNKVRSLHSSLSTLTAQPEVQALEASVSLRAHSDRLRALEERCAALPAELTLSEEVWGLFNPRLPANKRDAERAAAIRDIYTELGQLVPEIQSDLISFGRAYRSKYIQNMLIERMRATDEAFSSPVNW